MTMFLMFSAPCAAVITKPTIRKVTNAMKKPMTKLSVISAVSKVLTRTALTTAARITPMTDITKLARERLEKIKSWRGTYGAGSNVMLPAEEAEALARIALDAMDRDQVRNEHAEWSQVTFGNVGPVGPLKHLSKEALEAAAAPDDLSEWADMQFLLWDAQHRSGIADEQITQAMIEKLAVNKQRSWPEPKDGEPRLHIKERPRKKVDRCDVCTEGARGGCGTCIFNGNFE